MQRTDTLDASSRRFLMRGMRSWAAVCASTLAMFGCDSDETASDRGQKTNVRPLASRSMEQASADISEGEAEKLASTIGNVTATGDFCPPGSWFVYSYDNVGGMIDVYIYTVVNGPSADSLSCTLSMDMEIPTGYQMTPTIKWQGLGSNARLQRTYSFEGVGDSPTIWSEIPESDSTYDFVDLPAGLWAPSCEDTHRVKLVTKVEVTAPLSESTISVGVIQIFTSWPHGAEWRACGSTEPVTVEPGGVDSWCGGVHKRACAQSPKSLVCDQQPSADLNGICVDLSNCPTTPATEQQDCGGVCKIRCEDGLECVHSNQQEVDQKVRGVCEASPAGDGALCGQLIPVISCKSGLFCTGEFNANGRGQCKHADGTLGSLCGGTGMPECNDAENVRCGADSHTCEIRPGKKGGPCIDQRPCEGDDLKCENHVCVPKSGA